VSATVLDQLNLDGRVGLVTGASRGLGQAMALALAEAGADVALVARSADGLNQTAESVKARGRRALALPADVAIEAEVDAAVKRALDAFGAIDILVNNSGVAIVKPFVDTTPAEWRRILETNLTGAYNCCRAVGPGMIARRRGKVVNVASVLGARGLPGYAAYSASKGGLLALTRALAVEWARHNIQVNAIAPGWFVTSMNEAAFEDARTSERLLRNVPARRTGRSEELGPLVVYLASAASDYVTGEVVFIDGGLGAA
jgi:NAD(P)-dependent dehydrogenase (short-subunit alcohol dehydrogenase family)